MNREDWRQTVSAQHQMLATIAGFAITGLIIFASFSQQASLTQKILVTASLFLLVLQIGLLLLVAEVERRTAYQQNIRLSESENIIRALLNTISFLSWLSITILIIVTLWS